MTTKEIRERIETIIDGSRGKTLAETGGIKHIGIDDEKNLVVLIVSMYKLGGQNELNLRRQLAKAIKIVTRIIIIYCKYSILIYLSIRLVNFSFSIFVTVDT